MSGKKTAAFLMLHYSANAFIQLAIVIIISRILGAEGAGHYALAQSYIMPAFFLGLFALKTQYIIAQKTPDLGHYLGLRIFGASVIFAFAIILTFVLETPFIALLALSLALVKFSDGFVDIFIGVFQRANDPAFIAKTALSRLAILLSVFVGIFMLTHNMVLAFFALALAGMIHIFFIEYRWCKRNAPIKNKIFDFSVSAIDARKALIKNGLPIALAVLLGAAQVSVIRILLEEFHGAVILGQFSAALQIVLMGNVIIIACAQAFMPSLSKHFTERNFKNFLKILISLAGFVFACVALGTIISMIIGNWLMAFIFGHDFQNLGWLLVVAGLSSLPLFLNAIFTQAAIACKQSRAQLYIYFVGFTIACIMGWILTQNNAMQGAYSTLFIVNLVQCLIFMVIIFKAFKEKQE